MKEWNNPEVFSLNLEATKGNPFSKGNDQLIPDCIENQLGEILGDLTGPIPGCS